MGSIHWPTIGISVMGGLLVGSVPAIVIQAGLSGTAESALLVLLQFVVQFGVGIAAGRLAKHRAPNLHGGVAALVFFFLIAAFSLAAGNDANPLALALGGAIALLIGTAGGVLGGMERDA